MKYLLSILLLAIPSIISAVPASPRLRTLTNPDGTEVQVRVYGDEYFHFMTDADCSMILERDARGFIGNAVRNGVELRYDSDNINILRSESLSKFPELVETRSGVPQKMAALNADGRTTYPTIGKGNRSLVVLVEFQDVSFFLENPKDFYTRMLNEPGFSDYGGRGSALDYYHAASNGLYSPQFDVFGPVKISKPANYFKDNSNGHMAILIEEALNQINETADVDFSNYDLDGDGKVDTVFFFYAGYGQADSDTETIWPHQSNYQSFVNYYGSPMLRFDGKTIGPYACGSELAGYNPTTKKYPWKDGSEPWVDGIGTFVHEYGHVLGLPDLYDTDKSNTSAVVTPGEWDVMDTGSYNFDGTCPPLFSAYEQWVCRWLEFSDVEDGNSYSLPALGSSESPTAARIRIPASADGSSFQPEYFIIEARDKSSWDSCFPKSGLMVWRINYNKNNWINNSVNSKNGSNVEIVYANGKSNPIFSNGAIYPDGAVSLTPSKQYPLWESPVISGIGYDADAKTGSFSYYKSNSNDIMTLLHDSPLAAADGSNSFRLVWDPVEGVDSYLLTVRTATSKRVIGDFNAKDVGNSTSVVVSGISAMYWKLELEAFVTCVAGGMPSSSTSNVVIFKPSELARETDTAVDSIQDSDVLISGGKGCVIAPEDAVIYTLSGHRVHNQDLAPGLYLVSFGARTAKVLVK